MWNFIVKLHNFAIRVYNILLISSSASSFKLDAKIVPGDQFLIRNTLENLLLQVVSDL